MIYESSLYQMIGFWEGMASDTDVVLLTVDPFSFNVPNQPVDGGDDVAYHSVPTDKRQNPEPPSRLIHEEREDLKWLLSPSNQGTCISPQVPHESDDDYNELVSCCSHQLSSTSVNRRRTESSLNTNQCNNNLSTPSYHLVSLCSIRTKFLVHMLNILYSRKFWQF